MSQDASEHGSLAGLAPEEDDLRWVKIADCTTALNVPGGCIVRYDVRSMVFVPSARVVTRDNEVHLESTMSSDMERALEPLQKLVAMFQGIPLPTKLVD